MEETVIPPDAEDEVASDEEPTNLLEQLAAKRKTISETKETFIPLPGYSEEPPLLLARYRLLDGPELNKIGGKVIRDIKGRWERQMYIAVDTFIAACVGFHVDQGNGKPEPMMFEGEPILGYTEELARALQFRDELPATPTARSIVFGVFANNDVAISQHSIALSRWMGDTSIDVSSDFLGNL